MSAGHVRCNLRWLIKEYVPPEQGESRVSPDFIIQGRKAAQAVPPGAVRQRGRVWPVPWTHTRWFSILRRNVQIVQRVRRCRLTQGVRRP